jgi:hypothetical protein
VSETDTARQQHDTDGSALIDVLDDVMSSGAVRALASALGIDVAAAKRLTGAVVPSLVERLQANASSGGADTLAAAVRSDHDGSLLDRVVPFLGGGFRGGPGMAILGHVFGDELDGAVATVADTTGLPPSVVRLGFNALAPVVLGAITKAAIGAVSAVVVIKLLDVAVDAFRSGRAQRFVGRMNARFDDDGDGNALDDVGRDAVKGVQTAGGAAVRAAGRVQRNEHVRATVTKAASGAKQLASAGARGAVSGGRKLFKKLWG